MRQTHHSGISALVALTRSAIALAVTALAVSSLALSSCAKTTDEDAVAIEMQAFDAWVAKYVLPGKEDAIARQSNGMYVEFIEAGEQGGASVLDSTVMWLRLNYTSSDIQGNVFATRDSMTALRQHSFTPKTYYAPEYVVCTDQNYGMVKGQHFALRGELVKPDGSTMRVGKGSHIKLYLPPHLAFGANGYSDNQGYGGQNPLESSKIVVHDLTVSEIIQYPTRREEQIVRKRVTAMLGREPGKTDTIAKHLYVDTTDLYTGGALAAATGLETKRPYDSIYHIDEKSKVKIWYVGRFLPTEEYPEGFIFDTNIESVYNKFFNRQPGYAAESKTHKALSYTLGSDEEKKMIEAFKKAIPALRRGQWSRLVFTSSFGYGQKGFSAAVKKEQDYQSGTTNDGKAIITEIQPYTPLVFDLYIEETKD